MDMFMASGFRVVVQVWVDGDPAGLEEGAVHVVLLVREADPANAVTLAGPPRHTECGSRRQTTI